MLPQLLPITGPPKGLTIRATIEQLLKKGEYHGLRDQIVMNDFSFAELLSGCHLSETVGEFFDTIDMQTPSGIDPSVRPVTLDAGVGS